MNTPSRILTMLAAAIIISSAACRSTLPSARQPEPLDQKTEDVFDLFGVSVDIITNPVFSAIRSGNIRALAKQHKSGLASDYPFNCLGALQMAALLGSTSAVQFFLDQGVSVDDRLDYTFPTPLHLAIIQGDDVSAMLLLNRGADMNATIDKGFSVLQLASTFGRTRILEVLHERGLSVDVSMAGGLTPLSCAVIGGQTGTVAWLIEKGADVNHQDDQKMTPLHHAAIGNHGDMIRDILDGGGDQLLADNKGRTPLMLAVSRSRAVAVEALATQPQYINHANAAGETAASLAVKNDHRDILALLAERGASLAPPDAQSETLLHLAVRASATSTITWLAGKIDKNTQDVEGYTPLARAVLLRRTPIAESLMASGADVNIPIHTGFSPLMLALSARDNHLVRALLDAGANPNAGLPDGQTPAMLAAAYGNPSTLEMLFDAGASGEGFTKRRHNIFKFALEAANEDNLKFLLDHGLDPASAYDREKWPVILEAAWINRENFVITLLDHGEDVNTSDSGGQTVLMIAVRRGHRSLIDALLARGADPARRSLTGATAWHIAMDLEMFDVAEKLAERTSPEERAPTNRISVYFDLDAPLAKNVSVAGTFNEWNSSKNIMKKRDDDGWWYTEVDVFPFSYEYKFVVDNDWITDPENNVKLKDGNAGYVDSTFVATNRTPDKRPSRPRSSAEQYMQISFSHTSATARSVSVAGEFNGWNTRSLAMTRQSNGTWTATTHLAPGEYGYKLVVDNEWILDPENNEVKMVNDVTNSLIRVGQ